MKELAQYATLASHDLKEPLRKLLTFSDLLLSSEYKEPNRTKTDLILRRIQSISLRMKSLIESISRFSNISQSISENLPLNLRELVDEVIDYLEVEIKNRNAVFFISTLPGVTVNKMQMFQLFENLISNALKYSKPDDQPVINIEGRMLDDRFVEITVSDNGMGFDNQYAEKVFQPFSAFTWK